jgi:serine kinase of HPr protein (carbohydrate metabolism regulator)
VAEIEQMHGTCVAFGDRGVLIRGESGAGKSDLALRLIDDGAQLVADDRIDIIYDGQQLTARAPAPLAGLIEVRGLGIVRLAPERLIVQVALVLVVDLVAPEAVDRLPAPAKVRILGQDLPQLALNPFTAAAPLKLRLAVGVGPGSIMPAP